MKKLFHIMVSLPIVFGITQCTFMDIKASTATQIAPKVDLKFLNYKKPSEAELKKKLTPIQFDVTQNDGTERAFRNEFYNHKKEGIYVDIVSGEPLFSSTDKFVSGTGWPSFTKPINANFIELETDYKLIYPRTGVRSKYADSHLGHVFNDGPKPTGKRYCINSAALRFVPKEDLKDQGYGEYMHLFEDQKDASLGLTESKNFKTAIFAGGCFWCSEADFEKVKGVKEAVSGYIGGAADDATYSLVSSGKTSHYEAVEVSYDPEVVNYSDLVEYFWKTIDPTDDRGQFCDKGTQYLSAIFYGNEEEQKIADESKRKLVASNILPRVVTPVLKATEFFKAEGYHQDYYKKNEWHYKRYRTGCGRDARLDNLWNKG